MGWEHDPETVWKAMELYCVDRLSFARTAERTGVSATTLKAWADKYRWRERREEIAQSEIDIRVNTIKSRKFVLEKLLEAADGKEASQMAFAVASLESLALKQMELASSGRISSVPTQENPVIATRADAVAALREAVERKLGMALSDPKMITRSTVEDVKRCLDMVDELEASLPKDEADEAKRKKGLSAENTMAIRAILGA